MTKIDPIILAMPELQPFLANADHIDMKTVTGDLTLREFLAGMFSYYPGWLKFLYRVRWGFVRVLGMKQEGVPQPMQLCPEDVPMTPGENAAFFTVEAVSEAEYWLAGAAESHLTAYLGVVREAAQNGSFGASPALSSARFSADRSRFHVITIVHYHKWTGPVYFNVIRPFHHLVVARMAQSGASYQARELTGEVI